MIAQSVQLRCGTGIFEIYKMNYVVFTTEFAGEIAEALAVCENSVESAAERARGYKRATTVSFSRDFRRL